MLGLDNPIHLLIIGVVVLLLFGAKRLPEMGHSLGSGLRGFRESLTGEHHAASIPSPVEHRTVDLKSAKAHVERSAQPDAPSPTQPAA
jgi:sec-independent protein translocase protein TatA